ncbi:unnamed protein product [Rhizoctonia solani]|uniref:Transmembrane protein n=1 Tax=Rhizoctonia solani TaxID=456999 RepID=A0A8H3DYI2_9AGAM|nr:unnamed protein product [Rhizoctonia solani]
METRYSSLPYTTFDQTPVSHPKEDISPITNQRSDAPSIPRRYSFVAWGNIVLAPATHFILSVGITIFVIFYVEGRHFNLTERAPHVNVSGGTRATPFLPTQSDIVTVLSSIIAVSKYALTAWAASLSWNAALFLMERRGITRRNLKILLQSGLLAPGAYSRDWSTPIIGALLMTNLVATLSSPILTGSLSWVPSNRLVTGLSVSPFPFGDVVDGTLSQLLAVYHDNYYIREAYVMGSVGLVGLGWGRNTDKGVLKRVSGVVGLEVNSTFENVTLPYFQVHSIRWIENRDEIPAIKDNATTGEVLHEEFEMTPSTVSGFPPGYAILVPNVTANWSSDPLDSTIIQDTRLLILYYAYDQIPSGGYVRLTQDLPSSAYTLSYGTSYYAFAWVTFSAGVGRCKEYNCILSNPSAIQNNTPVELEPHQLTFQALSMAPVVGSYLVNQNTSIPYGWNNISDYVEAVLVRSYSGAWCNLNSGMQTSTTRSRYVPSVPSLMSHVDQKRVYAWFGIQILVAILSILFLAVHSRLSKYLFAGDPSLTAFYLDTTAIPRDQSDPSVDETRKIEQRGDRFKVKVE